MGRGYVSFHLPESGREEGVLDSAFFDYNLAVGSILLVLQQPAWCPTCRGFVMAEEVPTVEELEQKITWFSSLAPADLGKWAFVSNGIPVEDEIVELRRYIEWRKERQSPPHCLECGRLNPIRVPQHGEFAHPDTGERVVVLGLKFAAAAPCYREFTPEGDSIGE